MATEPWPALGRTGRAYRLAFSVQRATYRAERAWQDVSGTTGEVRARLDRRAVRLGRVADRLAEAAARAMLGGVL